MKNGKDKGGDKGKALSEGDVRKIITKAVDPAFRKIDALEARVAALEGTATPEPEPPQTRNSL